MTAPHDVDPRNTPTLIECVEWRPMLWARATESALELAADVLTPGSNVLEVGYHSGMMSCYLARHYGVRVFGYEINAEAEKVAIGNRERFGLDKQQVAFRVCRPDETMSITGTFDAIFMKSFLAQVSTPPDYVRWLTWARSLLRPSGCLIAVENGAGNWPVKLYRSRISQRRYARFCLIDHDRLNDFRSVFGRVDVRFFGRYSQFLEGVPALAKAALFLESHLSPPNESVHFVAAVVARSS